MIKLYLDNCCYSRPFDDIAQEKIRLEVYAINHIFEMYVNGKVIIYRSRAIDYEINNIANANKRRQVEDLYDALGLENIPYKKDIDKRVEELKKYHIHYMDAYHVAYAESKEIDYFITVDKQLINASKKVELKMKVINPIEFILEVK